MRSTVQSSYILRTDFSIKVSIEDHFLSNFSIVHYPIIQVCYYREKRNSIPSFLKNDFAAVAKYIFAIEVDYFALAANCMNIYLLSTRFFYFISKTCPAVISGYLIFLTAKFFHA